MRWVYDSKPKDDKQGSVVFLEGDYNTECSSFEFRVIKGSIVAVERVNEDCMITVINTPNGIKVHYIEKKGKQADHRIHALSEILFGI